MDKADGGDNYSNASIQNSPGAALGRGSRGHAVGNFVNTAGTVDPEELAAALNGLSMAIDQSQVPLPTKRCARDAVSKALDEGMADGNLKPEVIVSGVKDVASALSAANVVVRDGTTLATGIGRLITVLGPLVEGGAHTVATWFPYFHL